MFSRAGLMKLHALENYQSMQDLLQEFENVHDIANRWTPDMPEWKAVSQYFATRDYQKALTRLEGLVVARLFELHKMGLSGTGTVITMCMQHCGVINKFSL
jgi:hypothetical protein